MILFILTISICIIRYNCNKMTIMNIPEELKKDYGTVEFEIINLGKIIYGKSMEGYL